MLANGHDEGAKETHEEWADNSRARARQSEDDTLINQFLGRPRSLAPALCAAQCAIAVSAGRCTILAWERTTMDLIIAQNVYDSMRFSGVFFFFIGLHHQMQQPAAAAPRCSSREWLIAFNAVRDVCCFNAEAASRAPSTNTLCEIQALFLIGNIYSLARRRGRCRAAPMSRWISAQCA